MKGPFDRMSAKIRQKDDSLRSALQTDSAEASQIYRRRDAAKLHRGGIGIYNTFAAEFAATKMS